MKHNSSAEDKVTDGFCCAPRLSDPSMFILQTAAIFAFDRCLLEIDSILSDRAHLYNVDWCNQQHNKTSAW